MIHDVDRPFNEMMLGLEIYIPMYMTGQISPFLYQRKAKQRFQSFVEGFRQRCAFGEAIGGDLDNARYYLTKKP